MNPLVEVLAVDSIGSVIIRGLVWLIAVIILAYGADENLHQRDIKSHVGFFFFFLFVTGALVYLIFGVIPTLT